MKTNNITVVDSIMGSGKTSWAIRYIDDHPDENILYITPYLDETGRIGDAVQRDMKYPENHGNGKLGNLYDLFEAQEDIASTHALFMKLTTDCKDALKRGKYTLFLDETIAAIEPYELVHKDDINYLLIKGSISIGADGFIDWIDEDIDTRYNPIKILAQNHSLFYVNQKLLMWRYPPEIFSLFEKVYIMTYLFPASVLKYYFDFCKFPYQTKSIQRLDGKYELCDYYIPDKSDIKKKIHIYGKSDLNDCFPQKPTALSANWFKNPGNAGKIKILKNNVYNYFTNKEPAKSEEIIWTTFKDSESKLKGKGYNTRFLSCNCRATNEYADATHLCYCLNVYPHVGVSQFFSQNGIDMDYDLYALSEMLQWIWRSKIRNNGEIYIYIPSKRMRRLLIDWLDNECQ